MSKFNFKLSPLYPALIAMAGITLKMTETEKDEEVLTEMKEAIDQALNYDGDLEDTIKKVFEAVNWAIDLNPKLQGAMWIDLIMKLLENLLVALLGKKKAKMHPLMTMIKAKVQANRAIRKKRKEDKKQS